MQTRLTASVVAKKYMDLSNAVEPRTFFPVVASVMDHVNQIDVAVLVVRIMPGRE